MTKSKNRRMHDIKERTLKALYSTGFFNKIRPKEYESTECVLCGKKIIRKEVLFCRYYNIRGCIYCSELDILCNPRCRFNCAIRRG